MSRWPGTPSGSAPNRFEIFKLDGERLVVLTPWRVMPNWADKGMTRSIVEAFDEARKTSGARAGRYSTFIPARFTTSAHLAISAFMNGSMSFSGMVDGSPAAAVMRCTTEGSASAFATSAFNFSTIAGGVFLGAQRPNHDDTRSRVRRIYRPSAIRASALIAAWRYGKRAHLAGFARLIAVDMLSKNTGTRPERTS